MSFDTDEIKNKMMTAPPSKKEFHFSGGGTWYNATIWAETIEEAEKLWHMTKQLINPPIDVPHIVNMQSTPAPETPPEGNRVQ